MMPHAPTAERLDVLRRWLDDNANQHHTEREVTEAAVTDHI